MRVQLTTLNAIQVRINQPARVGMIGPNAQVFTGRVMRLSPQASVPNTNANPTEASASSGQQTKVDTQVLLERPSNTLIPGSLVSVEIVTARRHNCITIPPEAVKLTAAQPFVYGSSTSSWCRFEFYSGLASYQN